MKLKHTKRFESAVEDNNEAVEGESTEKKGLLVDKPKRTNGSNPSNEN